MAYANGNPVLIANPTQNAVTVAGTTINPGKCLEVTPNDAVAVTLTAGLTKNTPVTSLAVAALAQAVQAGSVVTLKQTDGSGITHVDQAVVTATAAAAGTSLTIASYTPSFSFTTGATLLTSSQGEVAGAIEQGCALMTTVAPTSADLVDNTCQLIEKGSRLLLGMARAVLSAGADAFGQAGL